MGLSQTQTPKVVVEKRSESYSLRDDHIQMPLLLSRQNSENQRSWIEKTFMKRECCKFIASSRDASRCCCGRQKFWPGHPPQAENVPEERWHPYRHTESKPTDAYGVLEFQGAPHPSKAQYVRLSSYDTKADDVLQLLQYHWGIELPKLLITVHGGILNFDLQPKLKRVFRKGLLKAAKTTGAWIITGGTNTGVTRHVGDAISDRSLKAKSKLIAIGIAPWGVIEHKDDLVGKDITVPYHCVSSARNNYSILNNNHSYFLLMDNGTVGKYGGEIIFRKRLEKYLAHQKTINSGVQGRGVPVICVVLEGGANTIRSVLEYVTDTPPVPVVVCDGSGRAADLLAFAHKYCLDDGSIPESLRDQLILTIEKTFQYTQEQAEKIFMELMLCVKKKELITVFRMGEGAQDIDLAILTALLKGTNASAPDQLSLALTWDRVDIARSHIFVYGQEWPEGSLEQAMMDALINDRVDFVKLLLENGVHMQSFLSITRLEELYNTKHGPRNTLNYLVRDIRKHLSSGYQYTLLDIGLVIEHLMGGAFRSSYCRKGFRHKYTALKRMATTSNNLCQLVTMVPTQVNTKPAEDLFPYPFHDLMVWAVLMKRQKMALFMWQHGEEAMAKALMACKLYRSMAHEADADDLEIEIPDEIRKYAEEFQTLALELLEHCYKIDDDYTQQLLTYELKNFSDQTCLSLAVAANHREFVAHKCSQMLLNDMWMGGLRMRKNTSLKVLLGILIPPYILFLEFKSKEELQLMPQTMEEHLDELDSHYTDSDKMSVSSFEDDQNAYVDEMDSSFTASNLPTTNKENGVVMGDFSIFSSQFTKKKKSPLRLGKKIYEFYNAPITKFWANSLFYCVFLGMYIYIVLGRTLVVPRWQEYYVMGYIATLAVEKIRQIIASEPVHLQGKLKVYFDSVWNIWDTVSIMFFASAVIVRHFHSGSGRVLYAINIVFWILRTLEIFSVNKVLGPYVKIIVKLLREMCYFLVILLVVVVSFGVVRESIQIQDQEASWFSIRNVLFYPYFMLYGELFSEQIDSCTDPERLRLFKEGKIDSACTYGSWVSPLLMFPYLLMSIVLMVNLLIARFNACFLRYNIHTMKIWKFQRYNLIVNYELHPILPPPLIILNHVFLALKFLKRRCQGKRDHFDSGLKLFLSHDDMEKLHDFEEECAEDYFREKELQLQSSSDKRVQLIAERVENMNLRIDDMNQKENAISLSIQTLDYKMTILEELAVKNIDVLNQLKYTLTQFGLNRSRHVSVSSTHSNKIRRDSDDSVDQLEMSQADDILTSPKTDSVMVMKKRQDYSFDKDVDRTLTKDTAMKSPVLVHSGKPGNDESMPQLTDFPKSLSKAVVLTRKRPDQIPSAKKRISLPKLMETSESDSFSGMDLQKSLPKMKKKSLEFESPNNDKMFENENSYTIVERRYPNIPKLQIRRRQFSGSGHSSLLSLDSSLNVDANVISNSDFMYSTTQIDADNTVSSHQQQPKNIDLSDIDVESHHDIQPSPLTPSKLSPINLHIPANDLTTFYPNTADYQKMCTLSMLTPILTAHSAEYTTITDQIDTSCMINRSPPRSPTLSVLPFASESRWEDDENPASRSEKLTLKHAEEIEHKRMEMVIRHRLRQISLDESSSISDIAKLVVIEMEDKNKQSDHDEDKDYPTEDLNDTLEVNSDEGDETPIMFEAALPVTIRIRRASTRDEDSQQQQTLST